MHHNHDLDHFLRTESLKNNTRALIKQSKNNLSNNPLLAGLNQYFAAHQESTVGQMLPDIKAIIKTHTKQSIQLIIEELLQQSNQDDYYTYPITGHSTEFSQNCILANNEFFDLSVNVINQAYLDQYKRESYQNLDQRGIGFYGKHQLSYFIDAGGLEASTWEFPMPANQQADELNLNNLSCHNAGNPTFKNGDFVYFKPNQCMMFERSTRNVIMLTMEFNQEIFPLNLMFSAKDLQLKFQNPTLPQHSRIQLFCNLLKQMDHQPAIPVMKGLLNHELHFIRWHAMQELLGLNALTVLTELKDMSTGDKHLHIRNAATQTLTMIEAMETSNAT